MDEFVAIGIKAVVSQWPMVVILGWLGWKGFPWALRVHGPPMVKETMTNYFNNGGGDKMKDIVRGENAIQTELHKNETTKIVQHAIAQHEEVEKVRFQERLDDFRQEITGEFDLRVDLPARRQPAPRRRRNR